MNLHRYLLPHLEKNQLNKFSQCAQQGLADYYRNGYSQKISIQEPHVLTCKYDEFLSFIRAALFEHKLPSNL